MQVADWRDVPWLVTSLYSEVVVPARAAAAGHVGADVYYNRLTKRAWALPVPPVGPGWLRIKAAASLTPAGSSQPEMQLTGPTPLAHTIVGGLIGAGLGYGGGALAEQFLPEEQFERGRLRRAMAILGGGLGTTPGLLHGAGNMLTPEQTGGGWKAWLSPFPFVKKQASFDDNEYGALFMPTIPKDAFNAAVWSDVAQTPNPYGSKSSWGDDSQRLGTPPPVAATVSGIVAGTAAATGQEVVSPWQVAMTAASTAGKGYLAGLAFGKTLGALAGLQPEAQKQLQQYGLWGGMLSGAVGSLFGRQ